MAIPVPISDQDIHIDQRDDSRSASRFSREGAGREGHPSRRRPTVRVSPRRGSDSARSWARLPRYPNQGCRRDARRVFRQASRPPPLREGPPSRWVSASGYPQGRRLPLPLHQSAPNAVRVRSVQLRQERVRHRARSAGPSSYKERLRHREVMSPPGSPPRSPISLRALTREAPCFKPSGSAPKTVRIRSAVS